ncbi:MULTISPECIES: hypothetical protein [unclassified Rhizobium]|uniref:hypothetical protein n=1 Tax=unclassified Rhizobium TaxID=2613769 RepID=UPI00161CD72C|nr:MULTISPECIES: hypothetical protein [unclassified Rhizobium]MBB3543395.1 hypothetical protein [Rhizobium sp. BK399]MCS3743549.1 hypothetical protein [Rhizobium sp. BK661]
MTATSLKMLTQKAGCSRQPVPIVSDGFQTDVREQKHAEAIHASQIDIEIILRADRYLPRCKRTNMAEHRLAMNRLDSALWSNDGEAAKESA